MWMKVLEEMACDIEFKVETNQVIILYLEIDCSFENVMRQQRRVRILIFQVLHVKNKNETMEKK